MRVASVLCLIRLPLVLTFMGQCRAECTAFLEGWVHVGDNTITPQSEWACSLPCGWRHTVGGRCSWTWVASPSLGQWSQSYVGAPRIPGFSTSFSLGLALWYSETTTCLVLLELWNPGSPTLSLEPPSAHTTTSLYPHNYSDNLCWTMVSLWDGFDLPLDIWQYLKTFLVVTTGMAGCYLASSE
jgi:hypothetical protein